MRTALTCLLLLAAYSPGGQAARSPQQRQEQRNPYLVLPPGVVDNIGSGHEPKDLGERSFTLRHIYHHGSAEYPKLHRYVDIPKDVDLQVTDDYGETYSSAPTDLTVRVASTNIQRLANRRRSELDKIFAYARTHGEAMPLPASAWTVDEVPGPNITDKKTILTLARVALNAYQLKPGSGDWQDVKGGFNYTDDFGWQTDGLRGHIFADEKNETVIIGLKGTSPAVFDGADTTGNDKLNDNLFGSCCCAQGGQISWKQVCDCMTSAYSCNNTCLVKSLQEKSHYYWAVRDLYHNVTERYPNSDVWVAGHSLGGVVSSLLGLTYGLPTVTYEAFPDALAASRLGLPVPPGYRVGSHQMRADVSIHHVGHTADPIFMGTCNAATSFCSIAGYAFEGVCHTGRTCTYDTVGDLGWRVSIGTHKISNVIRDVLEKYDTVPSCEADVECQDCFNWKFFESNGTESTTTATTRTAPPTTSSVSTRTRTETCKTPGWWGCLDESTTTKGPTSSTTLTSKITTTTCKTPGWFGCKDLVSTTVTSTIPTTVPISPTPTSVVTTTTTTTATCKTPGWFGGCNDETATSSGQSKTSSLPPSHSSIRTAPTPTQTTHSCTSKEWFGLICVDPSPTDERHDVSATSAVRGKMLDLK